MNREEGYYWVKEFGNWEARYFKGSWDVVGADGITVMQVDDDYFSEINETRIPSPDEVTVAGPFKANRGDLLGRDKDGNIVNLSNKQLVYNPNAVKCECGTTAFYSVNGFKTIHCWHCEREYKWEDGEVTLIDK